MAKKQTLEATDFHPRVWELVKKLALELERYDSVQGMVATTYCQLVAFERFEVQHQNCDLEQVTQKVCDLVELVRRRVGVEGEVEDFLDRVMTTVRKELEENGLKNDGDGAPEKSGGLGGARTFDALFQRRES